MQNDPHSHGLWEMTAPAGPETQTIEGELTADVVIVGAGYAGLSSALHLAEAGVDAVVLEAVDIGFGGAGRNVGLVNAGMWMMPNDVIGGLGAEHGERLLEVLGDAPEFVFDLIDKHHIECEAERTGTLHCAVGRGGLAELKLRTAQWTDARRASPAARSSRDRNEDRHVGLCRSPARSARRDHPAIGLCARPCKRGVEGGRTHLHAQSGDVL